MADHNCCPTCGSELPANAPLGLCPACLLRQGLGTGVPIGQPLLTAAKIEELPVPSPIDRGGRCDANDPLVPSAPNGAPGRANHVDRMPTPRRLSRIHWLGGTVPSPRC